MKMMLGRLAVPRAVPSPAAQPGQIERHDIAGKLPCCGNRNCPDAVLEIRCPVRTEPVHADIGKEEIDTGGRPHQPLPSHARDNTADGKGEDEQCPKEGFTLDLLIQKRGEQKPNHDTLAHEANGVEEQIAQVYLEAGQRLKPGESLALTMKVIPQGPNTVGFDAFAEGRLVLNN